MRWRWRTIEYPPFCSLGYSDVLSCSGVWNWGCRFLSPASVVRSLATGWQEKIDLDYSHFAVNTGLIVLSQERYTCIPKKWLSFSPFIGGIPSILAWITSEASPFSPRILPPKVYPPTLYFKKHTLKRQFQFLHLIVDCPLGWVTSQRLGSSYPKMHSYWRFSYFGGSGGTTNGPCVYIFLPLLTPTQSPQLI
jgi:hypothetical protein